MMGVPVPKKPPEMSSLEIGIFKVARLRELMCIIDILIAYLRAGGWPDIEAGDLDWRRTAEESWAAWINLN